MSEKCEVLWPGIFGTHYCVETEPHDTHACGDPDCPSTHSTGASSMRVEITKGALDLAAAGQLADAQAAAAIAANAVSQFNLEVAPLDDYRQSAVIGDGLAICGIAPKVRLVTFATEPCDNCQGRVLRRFSGSGWYEDDFPCLDCGENVGTGYRPFRRAWRKANIARAEEWLSDFVEPAMFTEHTCRLIADEMGRDTEPDEEVSS